MPLLLLIRHGVTAATARQLVGRRPGIHLSDPGLTQAAGLVPRLEGVPVDAIYTSPLERAQETAAPLAAARSLEVRTEPGLLEVDYGAWTGQSFARLRRLEAWKELLAQPAEVRFPEGESLREAQARVVTCLDGIAGRHRSGVIAAVSHGDPIRLALTHYLGLDLAMLHRLHVATASVSAVLLRARSAPVIVRVNDTAGLRDLAPPARRRRSQN